MSQDHHATARVLAPGTRADMPTLLWLRTFPGQPPQVREARRWIESVLPGCGPRDDLVMIASEFCANSIEHTRSGNPGGQFAVHLAWSATSVRLTVGDDGSDEAPRAVTATLQEEYGRGLDIVGHLATAWDFTGDENRRWLWADVPWQGQGGPTRIRPGAAMPTAEAIRRLRLSCPGTQIGYDGEPAAWWSVLPGASSPSDLISAPCFGTLAQMTAAAWTARCPGDPALARKMP